MSVLRLRYQTVEFGALDIHLRTLRDRQEFQDPDGAAEALGISSAVWPLFGVLWDSGRALGRLMVDYPVGERRVLEVGCGIGLASLVLQGRRRDVTATDYHPEADSFLRENAELNGSPPIPFERTGWADEDDDLGTFDLIIGSDILYEREHVGLLAGFIDRHARETCEVLLMDPGRGEGARFGRKMESLGYQGSRVRAHVGDREASPYRGEVLRFVR